MIGLYALAAFLVVAAVGLFSASFALRSRPVKWTCVGAAAGLVVLALALALLPA